MNRETIEIRRPDDLHLHLREGRALGAYARRAALHFARVLAMPNTSPPILTADDLRSYRALILEAAPRLEPLMTFKITESLGKREVRELAAAGAVAGKLYPRGATTNSDDGVRRLEAAFPAFEAMEEAGLVLCIHGEEPEAPALERERAFLPSLRGVVKRFPWLRVVLEHVSSREGVEAVLELPETVAATVTVHHLLFTIDDLLGGPLDPHFFCRPLLKGEADRAAIERVVLEGNPRFFFGSDSAPHPRSAKERGAAGVYSMPVALPLLAAFFSGHGRAEALEPFVSRYGAEFYRLPLNDGRLTLRRSAWRVPQELDGVVPLMAGRELAWSVDESEDKRGGLVQDGLVDNSGPAQ